MSFRALGWMLLPWAVAAAGCSSCRRDGAAGSHAGLSPSASTSAAERAVAIDATGRFDDCTLGHHGVLVDFGDPTARVALHQGAAPRTGHVVERVEREGATWGRVKARSLAFDFVWIPPPRSPRDEAEPRGELAPFAVARVRGGAAKSVTVLLNGKPLGTWTLARNDVRIAVARGGTAQLDPGTNEIVLRFNGAPRGSDDALAEIDWVHVGEGEPPEGYAAPTRADALVESTIDGVAKRAISLRAPAFVRCGGWIPKGGALDAAVAVVGGIDVSSTSEAEVELRLLRDREEPKVLSRLRVTGGPSPKWTPLAPALPGPEGLAVLELAVTRTSKGARVLFGEPRVVDVTAAPEGATKPVAATVPPSRNVVLVVLSGLAMRTLSLYGGARPLPELSQLAASGLVFEANRATAATASGAFASMLTGLPARQHAVEDPDARLPRTVTTVADAARQAGIATAMFTANPTTGPAFGFDRGWDDFVAQAPVGSARADRIFDEAAEWIDAHRERRFFVTVHARGGHPPWDASAEDLRLIARGDDAEELDPRRAAEFLSRARRTGRLSEAARARAWALYALAVDAHDAALGRLVAALRAAGVERETTIIVTGDVSVPEGASVPFVDVEALDESLLATPLVVRPAGQGHAVGRVSKPTSSADIARTIVDALGLSAPTQFGGADLYQVATAPGSIPRPLLATAPSRFALRWGHFVLFGERERDALVCDSVLEPTCLTDVRETHPLTLQILQRVAIDALSPPRSTKATREPAVIDTETAEALRAWGRILERPKEEKGR